MGFPSFAFQTELSAEAPVTLKVLLDAFAQLQGYLSKEHNADGGHTIITAQGLQLTTQPALPGDDALKLAPGDEWNTTVVGTVNLERQGKQVVRVTSASGTPQITAIADNAATTALKGEMFVSINTSGTTINILNNAGGFFDHQRIATPGQTTYAWVGQEQLIWRFDFVSQRWRFTGPFIDATRLIPTGGAFVALFKTACPSGWTAAGTNGRFIRIAAAFGGTGGANTHTQSITGGASVGTGITGTYPNHVHTVTGNTDDPIVTADDHSQDVIEVELAGGNPVEVVESMTTNHVIDVDYDTGFSTTSNNDGGGSISASLNSGTVDVGGLGVSDGANVPEYEEWVLCSKD